MYRIYLPDRWWPEYARPHHGPPEVGWLIAHEHCVWQVLKVRPYAKDQWSAEDRQRVALRGPSAAPIHVIMRPHAINDTTHDPVALRDAERSFSAQPFKTTWWVMRDEHYPLCARCGEPPPCREVWAARIASRLVSDLARYETDGVCPACNEPVTARQKSITFSENLRVIGGPPVTFHRRGRCRLDALAYEKQWVAADPQRRRTRLRCPGHLVNHADKTFECSEGEACRGGDTTHHDYRTCNDEVCHRNGNFGCYPKPGAVRRGAVG